MGCEKAVTGEDNDTYNCLWFFVWFFVSIVSPQNWTHARELGLLCLWQDTWSKIVTVLMRIAAIRKITHTLIITISGASRFPNQLLHNSFASAPSYP